MTWDPSFLYLTSQPAVFPDLSQHVSPAPSCDDINQGQSFFLDIDKACDQILNSLPFDLPALDLNLDTLNAEITGDPLVPQEEPEPLLLPCETPASCINNPTPPDAEQSWIPEDVFEIGYQDENGDWRCKYSGCLSKKAFLRACDLRKHYRLHQRTYFCSYPDCSRSLVGFSTSKDCRRHMRSHRPTIECPAPGCARMFSRVGMSYPYLPGGLVLGTRL